MPLLHGGGQERGLRSGTLPTHQIVGLGAAFRIAAAEMADEARASPACASGCGEGSPRARASLLNGHPSAARPGILNVTVDGVEGESLLFALPELAVASGSACATTQRRAVLRAAGARPQRPAGAELAAPEPRPLHDGSRGRSAPARRSRAAVSRLRAVAPEARA